MVFASRRDFSFLFLLLYRLRALRLSFVARVPLVSARAVTRTRDEPIMTTNRKE